jgi:RNA polymerase sigma factor (sigma-70 family)
MMPRDSSDNEPARRARFEAVYAEYHTAIHAYVYRRLPEATADVPDVVAEVFTVAWRRLDKVPSGSDARLWLYGVARRSVADYQRGKQRRLRLVDRLRRDTRTQPTGSDAADRDHDLLSDAIERLPDKDREVLRLVLWDGCSHGEAATMLGCSVHAVAVRLHKAKSRLRQDPRLARQLQGTPTERALDARRR